MLTARFWRTRRAAAIAGIVFGVLLITAMVMARIALEEGSLESLESDAGRRRLIRFSLNLVPFAGIAFLWFIGVLLEMLAGRTPNIDIWAYGRSSTQVLISVYAMRMAAVFTLSVSTLGLRTSAIPRWVSFLGYAVALVLLVAAGEHKWTQLVFPAWVLLLSVVILVTRPAVRDTVTGAST